MPIVRKFIRHSSPKGLKAYFEHQGIDILDIDWRQEGSTVIKQILRSVDCLCKEQKIRLKIDAERISQMTDELGQQSLLAMVKNKDAFKALVSPYDRSGWVCFNEPTAFRYAEDVRYADQYRGKARNWRCFEAPKDLLVATDSESLQRFKQKIHHHFQFGERVLIELFSRTRTDKQGEERTLIQVMIYQEGLPHSDLEIQGEDLVSNIRLPLREQALTYEPKTGALEVVASTKEHRAFIAEAFADVLLKAPNRVKALPVRYFNLAVLRTPYHFDTDPNDHIAEIKVVMLRLQSANKKGKIILDVPANGEQDLYQYADQSLGFSNPLDSSAYKPTKAKLWIRFLPDKDAPKGKVLSVGLTYPNSCNLSRKTEKERLIRDKYLKHWGLLQASV